MFLLLVSAAYSQTTSDGGAEGKSFGNETIRLFDNKDKLDERANKPLTSDGVKMKTLDDETSFTATLLCTSTKNFLRIRILPQNGGEGKILIDQDIDTDGSYDFSADAGTFSGVCSNGYITCTPGTWTGCVGRKWKADSSTKKIGVETVGISQLANCACINNSCGTNLLYNNAEIILSQLGIGITFALHEVDSTISIAKADYDTNSLTAMFYAQRVSSCSDINTGTGSSNLGQYYNYSNPAPLENEGSTRYNNLQLSSTDDKPEDIYYYAAKGNAVVSNLEYRVCSVMRNISVDTISGTDLISYWKYDKTYGIDHYATAIILKNNNTITLRLEGRNPGGWIQPPGAEYTVVQKTYDESISITAAYASTQSVAAVLGCWSGAYNTTIPSIDTRRRVSGDCGGRGTQYIYFCYDLNIEYKQDSLREGISDSCSTLSNDSNCTLFTEVVDGVKTIQNSVSTGLIPLPSCKTITGQIKTFDICYDWWKKERTYKCTRTSTEELDADTKNRLNEVYSSARKDGNTMSYSDSYGRDTSGSPVASHYTTAEITVSDYNENCIKGCKVRKLVTNTNANAFGNATQYQQTSNTYEFKFYKCEEINGALTCPTTTGDEIMKDCQCINEFPEAATAMSIINDAAKDIICSSGQEK